MAHDFGSQEWVDCIQQALLRHTQRTLENLCLTYRCWELHQFATLGSVPLLFDQFSRLSFLKLSAILIFGEQHVMFQDGNDSDVPWDAEEAMRIYDCLLGVIPPRLQRLHLTEFMEIIKRERPTSLFADIVQAAPLQGFRELILMDTGPNKDSIEDVFMSSEALENATRIADACIRRDFEFELAMIRHNYYHDWLKERGWGMEGEVRWNCEGEDPSVQTAHFRWDFEFRKLVQVTSESDADQLRRPLLSKHETEGSEKSVGKMNSTGLKRFENIGLPS